MDVRPEPSGLLAKNAAALTKLFSICLQEILRIVWLILSVVFGLWAKVFESFARIDFSRYIKTKFYSSRRIFDVERFFFELLFSFPSLSVWSKWFWTFVRRTPCALSKLRSIYLKKSFDENVFQTCFSSSVLRSCANFLWLSDRVFPAGLSKLDLICPCEHFKGTLVLWKRVIVFFFSDFERNDSKMLSKLKLSSPEEFSKQFFKNC